MGDTWKAVQPYVFGGVSGMTATTIIQPIDMIKVRIQLAGEGGKSANTNPIALFRQIVAKEGFFSLYRGLSAGLLRQATYTTARLGLFNSFKDIMVAQNKGGKPSFAQSAVAGLAAGGLGALIGNPADLSLIRMQADGTLPVAERRGYKNVFDALVRIAREEGVLALWKGSAPTVVRAMALNFGQLTFYDQSKQQLNAAIGPGAASNFGASAIAGFFASFFSLPFDFVKTRVQKQKPDPVTGKLPYSGPIDCALKVARNEGPTTFYRGFATYYVRIAPHAMITLLVADALKAFATGK
ncbi:2-oxoglutarate/malate translocator [Gonapodya prolifera JEL478]|uniref:2-oxoglutarate/malate translocator n=1 Tax=Gonapodya prolifera (strain JEL478) TaxID=1344416 RepID=A0A139AN69_GONPJ|nr:2-oxoglutarate/malate translocator [Gonapodya prolifera JEL478]|eukprot:KXS18187.1 2-oxoglutarate/malate translocator [Gonapodya prolifera JEL478]